VADFFERGESVLAGHANVEQHHVGLELLRELHGLVTRRRLADDFHVRVRQQTHQPTAHHLVIIRDHHLDRHVPLQFRAERTVLRRGRRPTIEL
jgi:hypothetical protein